MPVTIRKPLANIEIESPCNVSKPLEFQFSLSQFVVHI